MSSKTSQILSGSNQFEMLTFTLDSRIYGMNVSKIREVFELSSVDIKSIPGSHTNVLGMTSIRGEVMSVINLKKSIGLSPSKIDYSGYIVVTELNKSVQAIIVDKVHNIEHVGWDNIQKPPQATGDSYLTGVSEVKGKMVGILDIEKVRSEIVGEDPEDCHVIEDTSIAQGDTIIIIDDSKVAQGQVRRSVEKLGFQTVTFENGKEAIDGLKKLESLSHIALVVCDVEMPVMDGYTFVAEARSDNALSGLKIVIHSSLSGIINEALIKRVGADSYLSKYDPVILQDKVLSMTGRCINKAA